MRSQDGKNHPRLRNGIKSRGLSFVTPYWTTEYTFSITKTSHMYLQSFGFDLEGFFFSLAIYQAALGTWVYMDKLSLVCSALVV